MVSSVGWAESPVLNSINPHFCNGDLVHLTKVDYSDLAELMTNAKAFVFPSIVEGFGLGNLEAARCSCPVISSDIGAHRYVMGENAFYFNPYSVSSLVDRLVFVLDKNNADEVELVSRNAFLKSEFFLDENVSNIWEEILHKEVSASCNKLD